MPLIHPLFCRGMFPTRGGKKKGKNGGRTRKLEAIIECPVLSQKALPQLQSRDEFCIISFSGPASFQGDRGQLEPKAGFRDSQHSFPNGCTGRPQKAPLSTNTALTWGLQGGAEGMVEDLGGLGLDLGFGGLDKIAAWLGFGLGPGPHPVLGDVRRHQRGPRPISLLPL